MRRKEIINVTNAPMMSWCVGDQMRAIENDDQQAGEKKPGNNFRKKGKL